MSYTKMDSIEADKNFKTPSGISVKTTGNTTLIDAHDMYVHEVEITEGTGQGNVFLLNLDVAEEV
ncbi:MAG: hypothetical protein FI687_06650 [SAR202 cluster bacterium]|nr:hypothetical protein [SAR202 cluster bacterium]